MDYLLSQKEHNYFIIFLCLLFLILIIVFKNQISDLSQFYVLIIIILLIIISCLFGQTNLNIQEKFTTINEKNKLNEVKNRNCYERSKEYDDIKKKIDQRLDDFRVFEEKDRFYMENYKRKLGGEYKKMIELGNYNLDYITNGEDF